MQKQIENKSIYSPFEPFLIDFSGKVLRISFEGVADILRGF